MKQLTIQINKRSSEETIEKFQKEMLGLEGVDRTWLKLKRARLESNMTKEKLIQLNS
ncbi:hypothetical protein [Thalassobacillus sp. C254]|uniref:hypothetical protein n=1 Tax=Thalassobacillus sp. C254 TaxID=1225341 RepID=UPI0012ED2EF2|nr:hypothetical protein [Thalassobacillus sp. C254]